MGVISFKVKLTSCEQKTFRYDDTEMASKSKHGDWIVSFFSFSHWLTTEAILESRYVISLPSLLPKDVFRSYSEIFNNIRLKTIT